MNTTDRHAGLFLTMFAIIRLGLGFVSAMFLFVQGALAAEKLQAIGYAVMSQSLVLLVGGVICLIVKPPPIMGFGFIASINSLILFRACVVSSARELESLGSMTDGPREVMEIIAWYYCIILLATYVGLGIKLVKMSRLFGLASMLFAMFLPSILVLAVRMNGLDERVAKRAVVAVGLALLLAVAGWVLRWHKKDALANRDW